jgi:hypothetical protein
MKTSLYNHSISRFVLFVFFMACMLSAGCVKWWYMGWGGPPPSPNNPSEPYYGTGTVSQVYVEQLTSHTNVHVVISSPYSPMANTRLLVVRDHAMVGKLVVKTQAASSVEASVLEGSAKAGDLAVGIQHEKEFEKILPARGTSQ